MLSTDPFLNAAAHPAISRLVPLYNEPHRHYHNLLHIHTLIRRVQPLAADLAKAGWVPADFGHLMSAIWFHDCYYDSYAPPGFNEAMSAQIMMNDYRANGAWSGYHANIHAAVETIKCTAKHLEDQTFDNRHRHVTAVMLDLDIAGFADDGLHQAVTNRNIAAEYSPLTSDSVYEAGRRAFLTKLMSRKKLYYTPYFEHLEPLARAAIEDMLR